MTKLTKKQTELLKQLSRSPKHPNFGMANEQLDNFILQLKMENPEAFLKDYELRDRVFYNEPTNSIPFKGYLIPFTETIKVSSI